jgi:hypothetical protein
MAGRLLSLLMVLDLSKVLAEPAERYAYTTDQS